MTDIIYAYTRKQAVEDGEQVDVSTTAAEAGIRFPVFLTRRVYDKYVTVPENVSFQDEAGRLWTSSGCCALPSNGSVAVVTASPIRCMSQTTIAGLVWCNLWPLVAPSTWTTRSRPSRS